MKSRRQQEREDSEKFNEFLNYAFDQHDVKYTGLGHNFYVGDVLIARKLHGFFGTKYSTYPGKVKIDTSQPHNNGWNKAKKLMLDKLFKRA